MRSTYPIGYLRSMCPCASCKAVRGGYEGHPPAIGGVPPPDAPKKLSLTILPGNYSQPLSALKAELVGNYALRIDWSDNHGSGIYSFEYLREINPDGSVDRINASLRRRHAFVPVDPHVARRASRGDDVDPAVAVQVGAGEVLARHGLVVDHVLLDTSGVLACRTACTR